MNWPTNWARLNDYERKISPRMGKLPDSNRVKIPVE